MVNILDHKLVPKHEVLPAKEKKELLERLKITPEQLPKIYDTDPIVKCIEAKKGDVVKITRDSQTAGETTYYRVVV